MSSVKSERELNTRFCANSPNAQYQINEDGSSQMDDFTAPPQQSFNSPEMIGSMQRILAQNVGEYVVIEFLIGTGQIMRKQGLLYNVATSFVVLYDDAVTNFIVCDIFSVKFVYFYLPGERPNHNFNILRDSNVAPYSTSNSNMRNQRR